MENLMLVFLPQLEKMSFILKQVYYIGWIEYGVFSNFSDTRFQTSQFLKTYLLKETISSDLRIQNYYL